MQKQEIHVVRAQGAQARFKALVQCGNAEVSGRGHGGELPLHRPASTWSSLQQRACERLQRPLQRMVGRGKNAKLGGHEDLLAATQQKFTQQRFRLAVPIRARRIVENDTFVIRRSERCQRGFSAHPPHHGRAAEAQRRRVQVKSLSAIDCIFMRLAGCAATCQNRLAISARTSSNPSVLLVCTTTPLCVRSCSVLDLTILKR